MDKTLKKEIFGLYKIRGNPGWAGRFCVCWKGVATLSPPPGLFVFNQENYIQLLQSLEYKYIFCI